MGKKATLSKVERVQIVILSKERLSEREISKRISCSKTAVHQAIIKFKNFGSTVVGPTKQYLMTITWHGALL